MWKVCGVKVRLRRSLRPVDHAFTHFKATYRPAIFQHLGGNATGRSDWRWITLAEIADFPFPAATHRILTQLTDRPQYAQSDDRSAWVAEKVDIPSLNG